MTGGGRRACPLAAVGDACWAPRLGRPAPWLWLVHAWPAFWCYPVASPQRQAGRWPALPAPCAWEPCRRGGLESALAVGDASARPPCGAAAVPPTSLGWCAGPAPPVCESSNRRARGQTASTAIANRGVQARSGNRGGESGGCYWHRMRIVWKRGRKLGAGSTAQGAGRTPRRVKQQQAPVRHSFAAAPPPQRRLTDGAKGRR